MNELTNKMAQEIWQIYVLETSYSMPAGLADKIAQQLDNKFGFSKTWNKS